MRPNIDSKAEQNRKLFVGGLPPKTDEESLRSFYKQWGDITDVVVMRDPKTSKSRGFGFVTYALDSAVDEAQRNRPHRVDGKDVDTKRAMPRDETDPDIHAPVKKIYVGSLAKDMTSADVENYFNQFGTVDKANVIMDRNTNTSRGFAFVTFEDSDAVDKIILARPLDMNGHKITVRKAVDKNDKQVRPRPPQNRNDYNAGWNESQGGYQPPAYDQGYQQQYYQQPQQQQPYYGNSGYGYNNSYDANAQAGGWQGATESFGSYPQQSYQGGPMRANPASATQYNRPAPYSGNGWSQR